TGTLFSAGPDGNAPHLPQSLALVPPDGKRALTGCGMGELALWDLSKGAPLWVHDGGEPRWEIRSIAVSADGRRALVGRTNRKLQLWDLRGGTLLTALSRSPE